MKRQRNGQSAARDVAAALEEWAPRVIPLRRREPVTSCTRCSGYVTEAIDEFGDRDDHCVLCGWRVDAPSAEEQAAIIYERNHPFGDRVRYRGASRGGVKL